MTFRRPYGPSPVVTSPPAGPDFVEVLDHDGREVCRVAVRGTIRQAFELARQIAAALERTGAELSDS